MAEGNDGGEAFAIRWESSELRTLGQARECVYVCALVCVRERVCVTGMALGQARECVHVCAHMCVCVCVCV